MIGNFFVVSLITSQITNLLKFCHFSSVRDVFELRTVKAACTGTLGPAKECRYKGLSLCGNRRRRNLIVHRPEAAGEKNRGAG